MSQCSTVVYIFSDLRIEETSVIDTHTGKYVYTYRYRRRYIIFIYDTYVRMYRQMCIIQAYTQVCTYTSLYRMSTGNQLSGLLTHSPPDRIYHYSNYIRETGNVHTTHCILLEVCTQLDTMQQRLQKMYTRHLLYVSYVLRHWY